MLNAHSIWTTARNISLSAKCIPGQIRRLCNLCNQRGDAQWPYTTPTQLQMSSGHVSLDLLRLRIQKMGRCPQDIAPAKIPCEGYLLY